MSRTKTLAFWAVLLLLIAFVAEGLGYGAFSVVSGETPREFGERTFRVPRLYMTDHPFLPFLARKGTSGLVEFDSMGNRGAEPESPKRRIRIVCLGGSTTLDAGHRWDQTWPGQLQEMLGAEHYEVINAGQSGATTADSLVKLALLHVDLKPDFVVVYHGTNDVAPSYGVGFRPDYAHRKRSIGNTPYPLFDRLPRRLEYSSLFVAVRYALVGDRGNLWNLYTRFPVRMDFENGPFGVATFRRNLTSMHALCREHGARLVLGTFVYSRELAEREQGLEWADAWQRCIDLQNASIRALAAERPEILLADLARSIAADGSHFVDHCHLTPKGNRAIASAFLDAIRPALRATAPPPPEGSRP